MNQREQAEYFRKIHTPGPLLLPNAWDAVSARIIELSGAQAIATSSAAIAWTLGYRDGQQVQREQMLQVIRTIVQAVHIPVTADIEGGYGSGSPEDVTITVKMVVEAGAVGINLEDSPGRNGEPLLKPEVHAERIYAAREAARAAGGDVVINARTDVYLEQVGAPETRFDEAVQRANLYREAGADCLFVPGVTDGATIAALVQAIQGPINILAKPSTPSVATLRRMGVARVSMGSGLALATLTTAQRGATEMIEQGTFSVLENNLTYAEVNQMFE